MTKDAKGRGLPTPRRRPPGRPAGKSSDVPAGGPPVVDPLDVPTGELPETADKPSDVVTGAMRIVPDTLDIPTGQLPPVDALDVPTGELHTAYPVDVATGEFPVTADEDGDGAAVPIGAAPGDGELIVLSDRPLTGLPQSAKVRAGPRSPAPVAAKAKGRDWVDLVDRWFPERYRVPTVLTSAVALVLTASFLFIPLSGTDLAAQVARGQFFAVNGAHTVDFRWYGGVFPYGYSAFAGPMNALMGTRGVGAVSCVLSSAALAWLLARYRVRRPAVGGVLAALAGVCNLLSGGTTFAMGVALGVFALVAVSLPRGGRWLRVVLGLVLAAATTAADPLAGLFVALAGAAMVMAGLKRRVLIDATPDEDASPAGPAHAAPGASARLYRVVARYLGHGARCGLVLCVGAAIGLAPALIFPNGGMQPFSADEVKVFVAVGVATFFLLPSHYRALRLAAVLLIVLTFAAYFVPSPIGSNVTRLPMLYAAPLIAAVSTMDRRLIAGAVVALTLWQPPLSIGDLTRAGDRTTQSAFYQPLVSRLASIGQIGRIEVVPLYTQWESTYVAEAVPLARGSQRQVDVQRNPIFYNKTLASDTYLAWLYRNAVSYVAVPSEGKLDPSGEMEANLIAAKPPYLKKDWSNGDWTLYRVVGAQQLVSGAGVLVDSGPTGVVFDTTTSGDLVVRVRWSRWLRLIGSKACMTRGKHGWVQVHVDDPGRYRLSSGWHLVQANHC